MARGSAGGTGPALDRAGLHTRYPTALHLYEYIKERMPVDGVGPGGLSAADYLAITSVILDERGVPQAGVLDTARAAGISLATTPVSAAQPLPPAAEASPPPPSAAASLVPTRAASGNTPPLAPTLVEPAAEVLWNGPSPFFVSMQTSGFADVDPDDGHTATQFEIRRARPLHACVAGDP